MASGTIVAAMAPPAGQTSNFVDPPYCGIKFLVVNCVFLPLAVVALGVRVWTRAFVVRSFRWDDYLMAMALILSCALTGVTLDMLNWGLGKHMWDVPATSVTPWFLKLNVISAILYCAATGFTKVSVLVFYLRIFPSRNFHICVWAIVFIASGYAIASILANILSCSPIAKAWDLTITSGHCMNRPVFYFANAGLGIFTDFATVVVPIPWLRPLQMPLRQKIAVGGILAMGCFVGIVSCIRLASLYELLESPDLTWATTNALMWCTIELNLGIFGGCITAIRPFIRQYFPRLLGLSSGGYGSSSRKHAHQLSSLPSQRPDFSGREHQYSATLTTLRGPDNDSAEHILSKLSSNHGKDADEPAGIVRTVEFDVENTSRPAP
ncbi:hypothetical protein N7476_004369 [Penicillium atrosanguineum]|uniref:Rhodopsin domain-containing protein n=1 Tax=Penicillium atrosanguineum TaxID=1132637 RepID=A0A9W9U5V2_9EURO|nr:hypothetical protein N7526_002763 [Penicillium atrosanguineum]KAJ5321367.1 hypothetical protein N7476_004369 [Penicillium atrosanguineum]